jgi:hypothetical protein
MLLIDWSVNDRETIDKMPGRDGLAHQKPRPAKA